MQYHVQGSSWFGGQSAFYIEGDTLPLAVERNFERIRKSAGVGNAAGYILHRVSLIPDHAETRVEIEWSGAPLGGTRHRKYDADHHISGVRVTGYVIPERAEIEITETSKQV